jgi:fatty acid amide hydrolase
MDLAAQPAHVLRERLDARSVKSVDVVEACLARVTAHEPVLRALAHVLADEARAAARAADAALDAGERRPLLGLPLLVKESISTAGVASTLGVRSRLDRVAAEDAVVVRLLRAAGAIVLGKGNLSQLLLFHEAENPLFGRTANPWALDRVPGGSSGGEAAALAAGYAPLGVGTDIGGSIRVPAAFTGTAGLKPTQDRWSNVGVVAALHGQEAVRGQCGPMARTARDVALLFDALDLDAQRRLDPLAPPARAAARPLRRVGLWPSDGFLEPSPAVRRGLDRAAEALTARGIEVVPFALPEVDAIVDAYFGLLSSDGGRTVDALLADDPVAPQLAELRRVVRLPNLARALVARVLAAKGERRVARVVGAVSEKRVAELWRLTGERSRLRLAILAAFERADVDLVLGPAHATMALRHGDSADFSVAGLASMIWNFAHFPAGVVPVGRVRASDALRPDGGDRLDRRARGVEVGAEGLPLGVQLVGRPHDDPLVLEAMIAIEDAARGDADFPHTPVTPRVA